MGIYFEKEVWCKRNKRAGFPYETYMYIIFTWGSWSSSFLYVTCLIDIEARVCIYTQAHICWRKAICISVKKNNHFGKKLFPHSICVKLWQIFEFILYQSHVAFTWQSSFTFPSTLHSTVLSHIFVCLLHSTSILFLFASLALNYRYIASWMK